VAFIAVGYSRAGANRFPSPDHTSNHRYRKAQNSSPHKLIYHQLHMHPDVKTLLQSGAQLTDAALERLLPSPDTLPHSIHRAMRHSVFAGGKRLRPILCMEAARMVTAYNEDPLKGVPQILHRMGTPDVLYNRPPLPEGITDLGAALEMIHTYSLIHDDLPALDNDDLRRGQPTCHVVFGEAIAILAGDALQTLAFHTIANLPCFDYKTVRILREVSAAIGTGVGPTSSLPPGMIGGQVVDIESEGQIPTADLVESIHRAKTGALITTSIVSGGIFSLPHIYSSMGSGSGHEGAARAKAVSEASQTARAAHEDTIARLRTFGEKAGLAFQIVDDVLDMTQSSEELGKTAGKDTASTKATWPAVFGIERSLKDAKELIADAFAALEPFGPAANPLKSLAQYLVERKN
jgi:geranylgeranyl diphosphate synthase type II